MRLDCLRSVNSNYCQDSRALGRASCSFHRVQSYVGQIDWHNDGACVSFSSVLTAQAREACMLHYLSRNPLALLRRVDTSNFVLGCERKSLSLQGTCYGTPIMSGTFSKTHCSIVVASLLSYRRSQVALALATSTK